MKRNWNFNGGVCGGGGKGVSEKSLSRGRSGYFPKQHNFTLKLEYFYSNNAMYFTMIHSL